MDTGSYLAKLERDMTSGFLHLLVLEHVHAHQPIHGYGLIQAMDEATGPRGQWKDGTVYPLLGLLEREGLLSSRWGKGKEGPRRKYYEMTTAGNEVRQLAILKWQRLRKNLDDLLEISL